MGHIIHKQQSN